MFMLHHVKDVSDFSGLSKAEWLQAEQEYSADEMAGIKEAIRWAVQNKSYDFSSLMTDVSFENDEIYAFFCKLEKNIQS